MSSGDWRVYYLGRDENGEKWSMHFIRCGPDALIERGSHCEIIRYSEIESIFLGKGSNALKRNAAVLNKADDLFFTITRSDGEVFDFEARSPEEREDMMDALAFKLAHVDNRGDNHAKPWNCSGPLYISQIPWPPVIPTEEETELETPIPTHGRGEQPSSLSQTQEQKHCFSCRCPPTPPPLKSILTALPKPKAMYPPAWQSWYELHSQKASKPDDSPADMRGETIQTKQKMTQTSRQVQVKTSFHGVAPSPRLSPSNIPAAPKSVRGEDRMTPTPSQISTMMSALKEYDSTAPQQHVPHVNDSRNERKYSKKDQETNLMQFDRKIKELYGESSRATMEYLALSHERAQKDIEQKMAELLQAKKRLEGITSYCQLIRQQKEADIEDDVMKNPSFLQSISQHL